MEIAALGAVAIAALIYQQYRHGKQVAELLRVSELARKEQAETAARERDTLIAQVQAPELAPSLASPEPSGELLHVPYDDDKAHEDYMRARAAGEVR